MVDNLFDKLGNELGKAYRSVATNFKTIPDTSKFEEEGILTPDEFIKAGDFLVSKCPTWKWATADKNMLNEYLPKEKQFLITTASCKQRANQVKEQGLEGETETEDGWVCTEDKVKEDVDEMDFDKFEKKAVNNVEINTEYFGMEAVDDECDIQADADPQDVMVVDDDEDELLKSRVYQISIAYDLYYLVPRVFLIGYDENGAPLSSNQVKEDVKPEYVDKTVTIEDHPHVKSRCVSIHPCRHAQLLKRMQDNFALAGKKLDVSFSLVVFLKFISSVVPTIDYDFTLDVDFV